MTTKHFTPKLPLCLCVPLDERRFNIGTTRSRIRTAKIVQPSRRSSRTPKQARTGRYFFVSPYGLWALTCQVNSPIYCNVVILPVATKDLPISSRFSPRGFLSRCKFSTLTTRQPMLEFCLLTCLRFLLQKVEYKFCFSLESNSRFPHLQVYVATY